MLTSIPCFLPEVLVLLLLLGVNGGCSLGRCSRGRCKHSGWHLLQESDRIVKVLVTNLQEQRPQVRWPKRLHVWRPASAEALPHDVEIGAGLEEPVQLEELRNLEPGLALHQVVLEVARPDVLVHLSQAGEQDDLVQRLLGVAAGVAHDTPEAFLVIVHHVRQPEHLGLWALPTYARLRACAMEVAVRHAHFSEAELLGEAGAVVSEDVHRSRAIYEREDHHERVGAGFGGAPLL